MSAPAPSPKPPNGAIKVDRADALEPSQPTSFEVQRPPVAQRESTNSEVAGTRFSTSSRRTPIKLTRNSTSKDGPTTSRGGGLDSTPGPNAGSGADLAQSPSAAAAAAAMDPLSQHILMRTNTDTGAPRLRYPGRPDSPGPDALQRLGSDVSAKYAGFAPIDLKDKKKGSFLSRLSMLNRKKEDDVDDASEVGEPRLSGSDARVFASAGGGGGYLPHHKEPPRYIRVRAHDTKKRQFNRMFLAQQLLTGDGARPSTPTLAQGQAPTARGATWALEFSKDGKYLAAAGKDQVVRVWAVLSTPEERRQHEDEECANKGTNEKLSAPVFRGHPFREYLGHTGEVLDLSWSKNNFLLSSSMDKSVRLWHVSRQECLCTFKHKDFVTSIAFHPMDDRFFLAGSLDAQLRLWSIPDKSVAYSAHLPDLVTAVAFTPDGKTAIGGVFSGTCLFYDTEGLKLQTQMAVRSSRGKNAKGSKITGIKTANMPAGSPKGETKVLITSNDSRIRMYSFKDKSLDLKLKGHDNSCSQIRASFSDDGQHIICGSEDKKAFIWSMGLDDPEAKDKTPCEYFDAHSARVSAAIFAPTPSRQLLNASQDPLFDLCNPPPVKLMTLEESFAASQAGFSDDSLSAVFAAERPKVSPAYLQKSKHFDGNIIVTADQSGSIKVFRQDCAYHKRRQEVWETGSTFSRKLVGQGTLLGRSGSVMTGTTASSQPHSRRTSVSQPGMTSDRINSWRHGIGPDSGHNSTRNSMIGGASIRSERSVSPSRAPKPRGGAAAAAGDARKHALASSVPQSPQPSQEPPPGSPTSSVANSPRPALRQEKDQSSPMKTPLPRFSFQSADTKDSSSRLAPGDANAPFWNLNRWRGVASSSLRISSPGSPDAPSPSTGPAAGLDPVHARSPSTASPARTVKTAGDRRELDEPDEDPYTPGKSHNGRTSAAQPEEDPSAEKHRRSLRLSSVVSRLSSEYTSDEGETRACDKCGSRNFKVKKMAGKQRSLCAKCGKLAEPASSTHP